MNVKEFTGDESWDGEEMDRRMVKMEYSLKKM